jgi:hypothetical protein
MLLDLPYALRMLRKSRVLIAAGVLSLAIGIGAHAAIFSVVHVLMMNPLPYPQPERLGEIRLHSPGFSHRPGNTWITVMDLLSLTANDNKILLLTQAVNENWRCAYAHADTSISHIRNQGGKLEAVECRS